MGRFACENCLRSRHPAAYPLPMKITQNIATIAPVKTRPEASPVAKNAAPVSESSRPPPQPARPLERAVRVDSPLKGERTTGTASASLRAQRIMPTPDVPPPPEPKHADANRGSHNANPGTLAYAAMAAARSERKGGRVDTSA